MIHYLTLRAQAPGILLLGFCLVAGCADIALCRDMVWNEELAWNEENWATDAKSQPMRLLKRTSSDDIFLPITSIEWGAPDRWSFTSRYIHEFNSGPGFKPWRHNFSVVLSPGTDGGRFGAGYQGLFSIDREAEEGEEHRGDLGFFVEARAVLLRTWGNPLATKPDRTFLGAELRSAFLALCNVGVGWYRQIDAGGDPADSFVGMHFGIGL